MLDLNACPNANKTVKLMNEVIKHNGWNGYSSEPFWQDTELGQPDFSNLFKKLIYTGKFDFQHVLYSLCEENLHADIKKTTMLCRQAQSAYALMLKSYKLIEELVKKQLPGATAKLYNKLNKYFPNNSVCITEIKYDNKTFYLWVYRYSSHWDENDEYGKMQRKYCVLKDYFYKLFLNNMDALPDGYHIFCPYTSTATDDKRPVSDILIWRTFKELRTKRIVDIITNKLKYATWDTTIQKMHPKASELSLFLGETVSYINKGNWNQYVDELKSAPDGFIYPDRSAEMKRFAQEIIETMLFEPPTKFANATILRNGNLYLVSGVVESLNNGKKITQEYAVEIKNREVVYTKIGDNIIGTYIPLNNN